MTEIPWWAWIGVGLIVAITSSMAGGNLSLFAWIGLVFIAIGIGKIVYMFVLKPKQETTTHQRIQPPPTGQYCPLCRVTVLPTDKFCRYCGTRLR